MISVIVSVVFSVMVWFSKVRITSSSSKRRRTSAGFPPMVRIPEGSSLTPGCTTILFSNNATLPAWVKASAISNVTNTRSQHASNVISQSIGVEKSNGLFPKSQPVNLELSLSGSRGGATVSPLSTISSTYSLPSTRKVTVWVIFPRHFFRWLLRINLTGGECKEYQDY